MVKWQKLIVTGATVTLWYTVTSALVVINALVWLPSMPGIWYDVESVLYYPFRPYFDLVFRLLGRSDLPYWTYALLTRLPFLLMPPLLLTTALQQRVEGEDATQGHGSAISGDSRTRPGAKTVTRSVDNWRYLKEGNSD